MKKTIVAGLLVLVMVLSAIPERVEAVLMICPQIPGQTSTCNMATIREHNKQLTVGNVAPRPIQSYDVLTKPNTPENYFAFLEEDIEEWCDDKPEEIRYEREDVDSNTRIFSGEKERRHEALDARELEASIQCAHLKNQIPRATDNNEQCADGFVKIGADCISHTVNCQSQFGLHMTGSPSSNQLISQCKCDAGYSFDNNQCVLPMVAGTTESQSVESLQAMIAQLTALVNDLLLQINSQLLKNS